MQLIDLSRSTFSALRCSSPTTWIIATASGPGLFYVWLFWLENHLILDRHVGAETGVAMLAASMIFAARIATHAGAPPTTPSTRRALAAGAAALVPILAGTVGYVGLLPFADRGTSAQVACLSYSYWCSTSIEPHVIAGAVVTVALLVALAPLPLSILKHGANGAPLTAALLNHLRSFCWLSLLAILLIANVLLNLPVWGVVAVVGDEQLFPAYPDAATHSVLALVYSCAALAASRVQFDLADTAAPQEVTTGPALAPGTKSSDDAEPEPATTDWVALAVVHMFDHWRSISAVLVMAAFLWLPLPLTRHSYVNYPCQLLAERTAAYMDLHIPVLVQIFIEQNLRRTLRNLQRKRNGAGCAIDLACWILLDKIPLQTIRDAEPKR